MTDQYILDGHVPVPAADLVTWGNWFKSHDRVVRKTATGKGDVSTVFLGLNHRFGGKGPPVLFETMVFGGPLDQEMARYCTWEEAEAGHELMVAKVKGE